MGSSSFGPLGFLRLTVSVNNCCLTRDLIQSSTSPELEGEEAVGSEDDLSRMSSDKR